MWVSFVGHKGYQLLTEDVWQNSKQFPRYFASNVYLLAPIASVTDEVSAPQQCHMVVVIAGYNMLEFCGPM